jgi:pyruvate formate lyase activating enzyme
VEKPDENGEMARCRLTRRDFLRFCGAGICVFSLTFLPGLPKPSHAQIMKKGLVRTKLSPWYTRLERGEVQCGLCPRQCRVPDGNRGFCGVRENRKGEYYSLVYGNPCALHVDPIEKKPFFHVLPSSFSFSIATVGCNLECKFCQNWEISQAQPEDVYSYEVPPEMAVTKAKEVGARSVAYTYTEPTVFFEYAFDTARLARKAGLLNIMHSNGFINQDPLTDLCTVVDAANIDLKGYSEAFYREMSGGFLSPVLSTLKTLKRANVHVEITNLVIPTKNDDMATVKEMCLWVKREVGADTPLHFSRFYPLYKLKGLPPTPVSTLEKARETALDAGIQYVYIGNVPGHEGENTFCARCRKMIIQRRGYMVAQVSMKKGKCTYCGNPIPGIWA